MRVLVVEDYAPLSKAMVQGLREAGYGVDLATDGEAGFTLADAIAFDAIILDIMLPGMDGLTFLSRLRRKRSGTPVLILTAKDGVGDRVQGLDLGADDYMVKPFAFEELLARLRAVIRRHYGSSENVIRVGSLEVDIAARAVSRFGHPIELSAREYALLEYLVARRGQIVTRSEIWDHVYDFASEPSSNVVDVYIGYLRRKLDGTHGPKLIHTRRGQGYLLAEDE